MNSFALYQALGDPLPTPEEMGAWDAASIQKFHIPESVLMENAGREVFHVANAMLAPRSRVLIFMGGGNNGGDGACAARHLRDAGHDVLVCHAKPLHTLADTARLHAKIAQATGVSFMLLKSPDDFAVLNAIARTPHMILDALLGTGFKGVLRELEHAIIRRINHFAENACVLSVDIPSGLDGATGLPCPEAVRAAHTVTFEAAKTGLGFPHAKEFCGALHVRRIGVPSIVRETLPPSFWQLRPKGSALPGATPDMHKGAAGRVLIFGGSPGLTGAPALAALGALRAGAGLVTAACPCGVELHVKHAFPEIMTLPLGQEHDWDDKVVPACLAAVRDMPRASALVIGPGMGRSLTAHAVVAALIGTENRPPIILDADGLFSLAASESGDFSPLLAGLRDGDCITPHPGEAALILGVSANIVQENRVQALRALTKATRAVVVLKGAGTILGRHKDPTFVAPFAAPSLAVGGSGDVLSGIIAACLAQTRGACSDARAAALRAACCGVHIHGKAGEYLDARHPRRGALAREIADAVPHVSV